MTYEEKKKIVEAVKTIQGICEYNFICPTDHECDYKTKSGTCCFYGPTPKHWKIHKLSPWTPEDVALAKALKAVGAHGFYKNMVKGDVFWLDGKGNSAKLPKGCLTALENGTEILVDTIISEAEGVTP